MSSVCLLLRAGTHFATYSAIKCHLIGVFTGKCFSACTRAAVSANDIFIVRIISFFSKLQHHDNQVCACVISDVANAHYFEASQLLASSLSSVCQTLGALV